MPFINHLASLLVNIVVNTANARAQLNSVKGSLQSTGQSALHGAARFYLLRAALLASKEVMSGLASKAAEMEQGFITLERTASEFAGTQNRMQLMAKAIDEVGITLGDLQKAIAITGQLGIRGKQNILEFSETILKLSTVTGATPDAGLLADL